MKKLVVRALSGAVYVALVVCSVLFGGEWAFPILCAVFAALGIIEFLRLAGYGFFRCPAMAVIDVLTGLSVTLWPLLASVLNFTWAIIVPGAVVVFFILLRPVAQLYSREENPVRHIASSIMSVVYVAGPLAMASMAYYYGGAAFILLLFVMIWLNDTGAFLVGSAIGRHRLFPRLSPKKSWEGFVGGIVFCVAAAVGAYFLFPASFQGQTVWTLALLGLVTCVAATWGDLFESMIKRTAGVKDSGNIMPGHGGILDRIDSLLFVVPFAILIEFVIVCFS